MCRILFSALRLGEEGGVIQYGRGKDANNVIENLCLLGRNRFWMKQTDLDSGCSTLDSWGTDGSARA